MKQPFSPGKRCTFAPQVKREMIRTLFVCTAFLCCTSLMMSQCVVINEILINGPGPNDGQNAPNTEEWLELYNSCDQPVDLSCYVLTDGDYGVTIPTGTVIAPGAYFTIGSVNAGFPVDLNLANCVCAGGTNVGVLTNGSEQMLLFDSDNNLIDGIIWGSGQMPVNFYQVSYTGCTGQNYAWSDVSQLEALPSGGAQGCVLHRYCDASDEWLVDCTGGTPDASNGGLAQFEIALPASPICVGDCIEWSLADDSNVLSVEWTFEGALTTASNDMVATACYDEAGNFDISVTIESSCGSQIITQTNAIVVEQLDVSIQDVSVLPLCPGESATLSTSNTGAFQWYWNNAPILNANSNTFSPDQNGDYVLQVSSGNCVANSNVISLTISPAPDMSLTLQGNAFLCPNDEVTLQSSASAIDVQWFEGGNFIVQSPNLTTTSSGLYSYSSSLGSCLYFSDTISVTNAAPFALVLESSNANPCPNTSVVLSLNTTSVSTNWLRNGIVFLSNNLNTIAVDQGGIYTAEIVMGNGCSYTSGPVEVNYLTLIPPTIDSNDDDLTICEDSEITLSASGSYTSLEWLLGNSTIGSGQQITTDQPGIYFVLGVLNDCSVLSAPFEIAQWPTPILTLSESGTISSCVTPYTMSAYADGDLEWTYEGTPITLSNPADLILPGNYSVTATNLNACVSDIASFDLLFIQAPSITIAASDTTPCQGEPVILQASGPYEQWAWTNGPSSPALTVNNDNIYEVTGSSANGCVQQASIELSFQPLPSLHIEPLFESDCAQGATLIAESNGNVTWFNALNQLVGNSDIVVVNPEKNAIYMVVSELGGCTVDSYTTVEVNCDALFIPSAITPNGDGINDVFQVVIAGYGAYYLQIFDRWGAPVFTSIDPDDVWTGGVDTHYVTDGIYHYRLEVLNSEGLPIQGKSVHIGHISVVR